MKQFIYLITLTFLLSCSSDDSNSNNNNSSFSNWTQYRGNNAKTAFSSSSAPSETPTDITIDDLFFDLSANEEITGSPLIVDGKLFITTATSPSFNYLNCFNLNNGDLIWSYSLGSDYMKPPLIQGDKIFFVASNDDEVIALNINNGTELWITPVSIDASSPTYNNGVLFVDNFALDTTNGMVLWEFDASINGSPNAVQLGAGSYGPSINDDLVFYSGQEQFPDFSRKEFIYAVNINTGNEVWRLEIDNIEWSLTSIIAISDNVIYFTTNDGSDSYRYAVNAATGQEIWKLFNDNYTELVSSPAIGYGKLIINMFGGLYAFDKNSGQEIWSFSPSDVDSANNPVIADNKVFIAGDDFLYAVDINNGIELWKAPVYGALFDTEPVISGGKVIFNNGIGLSILQ